MKVLTINIFFLTFSNVSALSFLNAPNKLKYITIINCQTGNASHYKMCAQEKKSFSHQREFREFRQFATLLNM